MQFQIASKKEFMVSLVYLYGVGHNADNNAISKPSLRNNVKKKGVVFVYETP